MSGDVVVRLTPAQRGALRSIAAITVETGEGGVALARAVDQLDEAVPVLTVAQLDTLTAAEALQDCEWDSDDLQPAKRRALTEGMARVRRAMRP